MKYTFNQIKSKTILIKFIEDEDEITEFIEINTPAALFDQVKTILNATEKCEKVRQNFKNREVFQFSNLVKKLSEIELLK